MAKKASQNRDAAKPYNHTLHGDEYDVGKRLSHINSLSNQDKKKRKNFQRSTSTSDDFNTQEEKNLISDKFDNSTPTKSDGLSWSDYVRLDDKLSDFKEKNESAHIGLRTEFESRIKEIRDKQENYISKYWYGGTIGALCMIVYVWYMFSYSAVHPLPQKVTDIGSRVEKIEHYILKFDSITRKGEE